ncbi:UDP-N-acetylmuramoyl-tripeptide--D-alanyl-D-alanine ligase [Geosporobacter ferrireducens]|uniref:UDP-N-acetylmuramoyl-tripeptide--D-alanyl-D-alanine ligase n=1 Tax=Geosporobacter ferrireducens TaxID=1424294 RepID=A0A1D8GC18_9FIRM|nr:UDP-N-acetylmuramoyl-tripeptide--D-alanyl-D-alanine ligase [Geosporobacter ferrireducens]AOT68465.1 hypothetical protein Gferi_01970 [Geosporobacter ferrireducens]MTI53924.1 UDP-N-acetylmuramoyl-tripeptide--D-alanyl-D-alanine ligase [Geosporobacter ferrireducens]
MKLTIDEILNATQGEYLSGNITETVVQVTTDSRKVRGGELFIPLIGINFDGHDFISQAVQQGAAVVLTQRVLENSIIDSSKACFIAVKDTLKALQDLAKYYLRNFTIPIVAVTGSTGKTTTKDLVHSVLQQKYKVLKSEGNFNNHIGLPLSVFQLQKEHEAAIFEMGMSALGEIDTLAEIVRPNISVITNIGLSHIEHLGSQENILEAKMEITNYLNAEDVLIVNGDDAFLKNLNNQSHLFKKFYVGLNSNCDLKAENIINLGEEGSSFDVVLNEKKVNFRLCVPGDHNIYNALSAIAVGLCLDMDSSEIQRGIQAYKGSDMRLHIMGIQDNIKVINDVYNASPDSMKAAISVLSKAVAKRRIAVLGDMLEMGHYTKMGHYTVGCEVAKESIDLLIVVGTASAYIAEGAIDHGFDRQKIIVCDNNQEITTYLRKNMQAEDIILVKGSRGMKMEEIVTGIQERS